MYNIYNGDYPTFYCSAGHYYNTQSEAGCAWTEGGAHFLALNMNSSSIYTYTDGTQWKGFDINAKESIAQNSIFYQ